MAVWFDLRDLLKTDRPIKPDASDNGNGFSALPVIHGPSGSVVLPSKGEWNRAETNG